MRDCSLLDLVPAVGKNSVDNSSQRTILARDAKHLNRHEMFQWDKNNTVGARLDNLLCATNLQMLETGCFFFC